MSQKNFPFGVVVFSFLVLILFIFPSLALSERDYSDKDFSVRLPAAFIRFTEISLLGGETVANRFSSAVNPASLGWRSLPTKNGIVVTPYYSFLNFQEGMQLNLFGESLTWDTRNWGAIQPSLIQIRSNNTMALDGLTFDYRVDLAKIQWGKRFGDWAFGGDINYARADVERNGTRLSQVPGIPVMVPVAVETENSVDNYRGRLGGLYQPAEKWLLGMIFEFASQSCNSRITTQMSLPPLPTPVVQTTEEKTNQNYYLFRPGVSYELSKQTTVFLDYQLGIFNSPQDTLVDHRLNGGVEYRFLEWLFVRLSPSVDAQGNVGVSVGFSAFLAKWLTLQAAYQYNMLPELEPEFGRAQTFQVVLAFWF